jgi:hypothetical protein
MCLAMARAPQLAAVFIALVIVLSAGGYGIVRGATAKDYSAYNECLVNYTNYISRRGGFSMAPVVYCRSYLPD